MYGFAAGSFAGRPMSEPAVAIGWPTVFDIFVPRGADYRSNLVVEAVFFWIELAAIRHMGPRIFGMGMELSKQ